MVEPSESSLIQPCENCGTLVDASEAAPLALMHCPTCGRAFRVKSQFHHFKLLDVLGSGGMGAVYRALDMSLIEDHRYRFSGHHCQGPMRPTELRMISSLAVTERARLVA